ncbi:MAG: porin family protein [Holosporaceae bacterium]|jgi:opacity protein-like surface antigen|nr:porin family protein [Holosporaceae bacterium]
MKKLIWLMLLISTVSDAAFVGASQQPVGDAAEGGDFLLLGEPERRIGGAYLGGGLAVSRISHKLNAEKTGEDRIDFSRSGSQMDVSVLAGFGSAFHKRDYIGIEMEIFRRFGGGESFHTSGKVGLRHCSALGMNLDIRPGCLFSLQGALAYVTIGVARIQGQVISKTSDHRGTFGSYYPTVGVGVEQMINFKWSIRGDIRMSITSKDNDKQLDNWKYDAKPNRIAVRILFIRNI